jgi:hypothetical protein
MGKRQISATLKARVHSRDNYICRACGFGGSAHFAPYLDCDHAISEKAGGETSIDNLQTLCKACNNIKGEHSWTFPIRHCNTETEVWAFNQKVLESAFIADTAKRLRKLK